MLIIFVQEIVLNWHHSILDSLKDEMVPAWGKAQELSEVCHVELEQGHHDSGVKRAVATSGLEVPPWLLNKNCGGLLMLSVVKPAMHLSVHILSFGKALLLVSFLFRLV